MNARRWWLCFVFGIAVCIALLWLADGLRAARLDCTQVRDCDGLVNRYALACGNDECFRLDTVTGDLLPVRGNDSDPVLSPAETKAQHDKWEHDSEESSRKRREQDLREKMEEIAKLQRQLKKEEKK
jgi:hypothetical protein